MKTYTQPLKVILLALVLSFGVSFVYAWTGPTATPPVGNTSAPINTSTDSQYKNGALGVGGILKGYGGIMGLSTAGNSSLSQWLGQLGGGGNGTGANSGFAGMEFETIADGASAGQPEQKLNFWTHRGGVINDRVLTIDGIGNVSINKVGTGLIFPDGTKQTTAVNSSNMVLGGYEMKTGANNAKCSAGKSLLGGGCRLDANGNYYLQHSYPSALDTWTCGYTQGGPATAFAICANILSGSYLVNSKHMEPECTTLGGTVSTDTSGNKFCKFSGSSCSSGWTKYNNWSTTIAKSANYSTLANNGNSPDNNCSYDPNNLSYPCRVGSSTCSVSGHTWSDVSTETKTCSTTHPTGYWSIYPSYLAGETSYGCSTIIAPYPFDCYNWANDQGYLGLETTVTAQVSEIGCY